MQIFADRHALHRIPELDRELPETIAYLRAALSGLGCRVFSPMEGALCAWFGFGREEAIAFRADIDALPIQEKTGLPFASRHEGRMHACGHDGHMAILLELARRLDKKESLPHNVLLVFQAAEETTGGAKDICDSGIFENKNIKAIFGMHLWPDLSAGQIASRTNELMARSCELTVEITGRSCHIARAEEGLDALLAGVEFVKGVQEINRGFPPEIIRVVRFGKMESGSVRNAVSDRTRLLGTLRTFQDEVFFEILERLKRLAEEISGSTGCKVEVTTSQGYPAVMNPPEIANRVRACGIDYPELPRPAMTTEDFAWYQRYLPGMFFVLGTGDTPALHNGNFNFDESILEAGADFFEKLALRYR